MITTKNKILTVRDIPSSWVFEHYLNLEPLLGQNVRIKSIFNLNDDTPSMFVYVNKDKKEYYYKDFSTGLYGDKVFFYIEFMKNKHNIEYTVNQASAILVDEFNKFGKNVVQVKNTDIEVKNTFELHSYETRTWTQDDAKYWLQYGIGRTQLDYYNVVPLNYYEIIKDDNIYKFNKNYIYGYFDNNGELQQVYNPHNKKYKFFTCVNNLIHGLDLLKYDKPNLVITSSRKDMMLLSYFDLNTEYIAPGTEKHFIKKYIIDNLKLKYEKLLVIFDNDVTGIKAAEEYKKTYNIDYDIINLSKDPSDSYKEHGYSKVKHELKRIYDKQKMVY